VFTEIFLTKYTVLDIAKGHREMQGVIGEPYLLDESLDFDSVKAERTEAHDLLDIISDTIKNLFELLVLISKSSSNEMFEEAISSLHSFNSSTDIGYINEYYPKLAAPSRLWLSERLGRSNMKRRQFLRYARDNCEEPLRHKKPEDSSPNHPLGKTRNLLSWSWGFLKNNFIVEGNVIANFFKREAASKSESLHISYLISTFPTNYRTKHTPR
jgi:hypothetical protein